MHFIAIMNGKWVLALQIKFLIIVLWREQSVKVITKNVIKHTLWII